MAKPKKEPTAGEIIGGFFAIIILICLFRCDGNDSNSEPETLSNSYAEALGPALCNSKAKQSLKSPSTADFPFADRQTAISQDKKTIVYTSYVDSQNSFGATLRTHFVCKLQFIGTNPNDVNSWQTTELVFLQ